MFCLLGYARRLELPAQPEKSSIIRPYSGHASDVPQPQRIPDYGRAICNPYD
jgi:hypothetical protein